MGVGKNILLVFLSILLVLSLILLGIFWSLHTFLYPQVYEDALSKSGAYNSIDINNFFGGSFIKIPTEGVEPVLNSLIGNFLSYLRGDSEALNLTIEFEPKNLSDFLFRSIEEIRICNPGEEPFNGTNPVCRPQEINNSVYLDQILEKRNITLEGVKSVNLVELFDLKTSEISKIRGYVHNYQNTLYGLFILVLLLVVSIFFLSDSKTRWSGVDFFIGGVGLLIISSLVFSTLFSNIPSEIGLLKSISSELLGVLSSRIGLYSYIIIGIGIIGFALSFFIHKKKEKAI